MCDTVVASSEVTRAGRSIFAKNSDREPGEAQVVELHGSARATSERTRCTYISIPSVHRTRQVLLCRPHWMWGAEMGANDASVVVGNEAVFTRAPREPLALLGMDLVRLVLERADSAAHGVEIVTALLEEHGQGGPAGHRDKRFVYDNSFIIADPEDAWVVETAERAWVAKRVRGVRAISNGLTLRDDWDRSSSGLSAKARDFGLSPGKGRIDFARTFGNPWMTRAAAAAARRGCNEAFLGACGPNITLGDAMAALREHGRRPGRGLLPSVCAHAGWSPARRACQTTGSLVSELSAGQSVHWVTATAAPCTSLFKPIWLDAGLPEHGPTPRDRFDARALWWRHELVHRRALADLPGFLARFSAERDAIESRLIAEAAARSAPLSLSRAAFDEGDTLDGRAMEWLAPGSPESLLDRRFWRRIDRRAKLDRAHAEASQIFTQSDAAVPTSSVDPQ
jgi:dipeptidase